MTKEGPVTKGKGGGGGGVGKGPRHLHPRGPRVRQLRGKGKAKEAGDAVDHADIWTARIPTAKRLHSLQPLQATTDGQVSIDEVEAEEVDTAAEFPCPHCHEEMDASALCAHLEDEHPFTSRAAATCPVCAAKVVKDLVGHISTQHGHYLKMHRWRKFKSAGATPNATLSLLGKVLHKAYTGNLLEGTSLAGSLLTTDVLVPHLGNSVPITVLMAATNVDESRAAPKHPHPSLSQQLKLNVVVPLSEEERQEKQKQAELRAKFVQELLLSTLESKK